MAFLYYFKGFYNQDLRAGVESAFFRSLQVGGSTGHKFDRLAV